MGAMSRTDMVIEVIGAFGPQGALIGLLCALLVRAVREDERARVNVLCAATVLLALLLVGSA